MANDDLTEYLKQFKPQQPKAPKKPNPNDIDTKISQYSEANGVDPDFVRAIMGQESSGNPKARSWKNAGGLLQVMPGTATAYLKKGQAWNPDDIDMNLDVGTKHIAKLEKRYKGDKKRVLAAYNAGEGNADRNDWWEAAQNWSNDPDVQAGRKPRGASDKTNTRNYIEKIYGNYEKFINQRNDPLSVYLRQFKDDGSASDATPMTFSSEDTPVQFATPENLEKLGIKLPEGMQFSGVENQPKQSALPGSSTVAFPTNQTQSAEPEVTDVPAETATTGVPNQVPNQTSNQVATKAILPKNQAFIQNAKGENYFMLPDQRNAKPGETLYTRDGKNYVLRDGKIYGEGGGTDGSRYDNDGKEYLPTKDPKVFQRFDKRGLPTDYIFEEKDGKSVIRPAFLSGKTPPVTELPADQTLRAIHQRMLKGGVPDSEELRQKLIAGYQKFKTGPIEERSEGIFSAEDLSLMGLTESQLSAPPATGQAQPRIQGQRVQRVQQGQPIQQRQQQQIAPVSQQAPKTLKLSNQTELKLDEQNQNELAEGEARYVDENGETYKVNLTDGSLKDESLAQTAEVVPLKLVPKNQRNSISPEVAQQLQGEQIGKALSEKYELPVSDIVEFYKLNGFKDFETGKPLEADRYYGDDFGNDTDKITLTRADIARMKTFSQKRRELLEQNLLNYLATGQDLTEAQKRELKYNDLTVEGLKKKRLEEVQMAETMGAQKRMDYGRERSRLAQAESDPYLAEIKARGKVGWIPQNKVNEEITAYNELKKQKAEELTKEAVGRGGNIYEPAMADPKAGIIDSKDLDKYMSSVIENYGSVINRNQKVKEQEMAEQARKDAVANMSWKEYLTKSAYEPQLNIVKSAVNVAIASTLRGAALYGKQLANLSDTLLGTKATIKNVEDHPFYQGAEYLEKFMDKVLPTDKNLQGEFLQGKIPQGLGSTLGMMLGGSTGKLPLALFSALQTGGDSYKEARDFGASEAKAQLAASIEGALLGPTEIFGIGEALTRLNKGTGSALWRKMFREAYEAGRKELPEEMIQEGVQTYGSNVIAGLVYDPDRKNDKDLFDSMVVAGITAPLASSAVSIINLLRNRQTIKKTILEEQRNGSIIRHLGESEVYAFGQKVEITDEIKPLVRSYDQQRQKIGEIQQEIQALNEYANEKGRSDKEKGQILVDIANLNQQIQGLQKEQADTSKQIVDKSGIKAPEEKVAESILPPEKEEAPSGIIPPMEQASTPEKPTIVENENGDVLDLGEPSVEPQSQSQSNEEDDLNGWFDDWKTQDESENQAPPPTSVQEKAKDLGQQFFPKTEETPGTETGDESVSDTVSPTDKKESSVQEKAKNIGNQFFPKEESKTQEPVKEPWQMTKAEFLDEDAETEKFRGQYVDKDGNVIKSSRTHPSELEIPPVGTWRISNKSSLSDKYGNSIEQLQEIPIEDVNVAEDVKAEGREGDVERYKGWIEEGKTAPPIRAAHRTDGKYQISDGHRRLEAAKRAGKKTILAWVSPSADTGLREPGGKVIDTDLTHQLAIKQALAEGKEVPPEVLAEYPDLVKESKAAEKPSSNEEKKSAKPKAEKRSDSEERETVRRQLENNEEVSADLLKKHPDLAIEEKERRKTEPIERALERATHSNVKAQNLLLPETLDLKPAEMQAFDERKDVFESHHFDIIQLTGRTIAIKKIPNDLSPRRAREAVEHLLKQPIEKATVPEQKDEPTPTIPTETNNDIPEMPVSKQVDVEDLEDASFTREAVERRSENERMDKSGLTKSQREWFVLQMQKIFDKLPFNSTRGLEREKEELKDEKKKKPTNKHGRLDAINKRLDEIDQQLANHPQTEITIDIPGDGKFKFLSKAGVDQVHKKLTGKTVEEFRKANSPKDFEVGKQPKNYTKAWAEAKLRQEDETDITVANADEIMGDPPPTSEKAKSFGVEQTSNGFWTNQSDGKGGVSYKFENAKPITVKGFEQYDLFLHGKKGDYRISEGITGLQVLSGETVEEVVDKLKQQTPENLDKAINISLKKGAHSPRYGGGKVDAQMRKSTATPEVRATKEQIEKALASRNFEGNAKFAVVQSESELPAKAQQAIRERQAEGKVAGLFHNGQVYLIADNLRGDNAHIARVISHEIVGHFGLRGLVGEGLNGLLDQVANDFADNADFQDIAHNYGLDLSKEEERREAAEEFIAHMAERENFMEQPLLQRIAQAIRNAVKKLSRYLTGTHTVMDMDDIRTILSASNRFVQRKAEADRNQDVSRFSIQNSLFDFGLDEDSTDEPIKAKESSIYTERTKESVVKDTQAEVDAALKKDANAVRIMAKGNVIKPGDRVGVRLNLNVLKSTGVLVQAIHAGAKSEGYRQNKGWWNNEVLAYAPAVTLKNAFFNVGQKYRENIAQGASAKMPMASIDGEFVTDKADNFNGVEVSFNPKRVHLFVDSNNRPVHSADEVTIYGHRAYLRGNITYYEEKTAPEKTGDADSDVRFSVIGEIGAARTEDAQHRGQTLMIAKSMERSGIDANRIFLATGWEKGKDGKWKTELNDSNSKLTILGTEQKPYPVAGTLNEFLDFPELYKAYPELKKVSLTLQPGLKTKGATLASNPIQIKIRSEMSPIQKQLTIIHEVQHLIQFAENFAVGGSMNLFLPPGQVAQSRDMNDPAFQQAFQKYLAIAGEVEARNTEFRFGLSNDDRTTLPFSATEDVPRGSQIVLSKQEALSLAKGESVSLSEDRYDAKKKIATNRNAEDQAKLEEYAQKDNFIDLLPEVATQVKGDELKLSLEAAEIERTITAMLENVQRDKARIFHGIFLDPKQVFDRVQALEQLAQQAEENGHSRKELDEWRENLLRASSKNGTVVLNIFDDAITHEKIHQRSYLGAIGKRILHRYHDIKGLATDKSPAGKAYRIGFDNWAKMEGRNITSENASDHQLAHGAEELFAYIADNDFERLGLTKEQAVELGVELALRYAKARIAENPKLTIKEALATFDETEAEKLTRGLNENTYAEEEEILQTNSPEQKESDEEVRPGNTSGIQRGTSQKGNEESSQPSSGATEENAGRITNEKEKGQKVAAFSRILGSEYYYDPQSHSQTEAAAQQLITEKGVDQVITEVLDNTRPSAAAMKVVYWELARLNGLLQYHLDNNDQLEADAVSIQLADLASKIIQRQVANGQETEIAKTIEPLTPESALLTANRIKKYAFGDEGAQLTPDQTKQIVDLATKLQKSQEKVDEATRKWRNAQAKIKRLEDENQSAPKEPKEPKVKPAEKLLKDYKTKKSDILARLEKLFPDSPLFNGKESGLKQMGDTRAFKTMAPEALSDEQREALTEYAAGNIVSNVSYESLMKTLSDLTGLTAESNELKRIHAAAMEIIKPSTEKKELSDAQKEARKIAAKHTREAQKFRKSEDEDSELSGLAKDAQDSDDFNDPLLVHAIDLLTNPKHRDKRSINAILRSLQTLGVPIREAENIARDADKAVRELRRRRQEARDEARGVSAEARAEMNERTREMRRDAANLAAFLRRMQTPQNLMQRANNSFRAKLVNTWFTQLFNLVQGAIIGGGVNGLLIDPLTLLANKITGRRLDQSRISDARVRDFWRPLAYIFAANHQLSEGVLANFPSEYERIHTALFGDIITGDSVSTENARNAFTRKIHQLFDMDDKLNTWLGKVSGAQAQEMHVRYALFRASLDQAILKRTNGAENLQSLSGQDIDIMDYVTEQDVSLAVDKALEGTFATMIDDPAGKALKRGYDTLDKFLPVVFNPITFARFTYTTGKVMVANPLLLGALDTKALGGKGYSPRSVAQGALAWGGIAMAYALISALGGDDDRWDTLYVFGKDAAPLSVKRFFPISAFFFVAHVIKNGLEGRPNPKPEDVMEGLASIESQYFARGAGMEFLGDLSDSQLLGGDKPSSEIGKSSARLIGNILAGVFRSIQPVKSALAQFDDLTGLEESNFRNYDDTATGEFMEEFTKSIPFLAKAYGAEKATDAVSGEELRLPSPLARAIGISRPNPLTLKAKKTVATDWAERLFPFEFDGEMTDDQKKVAAIRASFTKAARTGAQPIDVLDNKIMKLVQDGALTAKQGKKLRGDMRLTALQYKVKTGFTVNDNQAGKRDMAALRQVWAVATESEKDDIRKVLGKKENRTPDFDAEFGVSGPKTTPQTTRPSRTSRPSRPSR